MYEQLIKPIFPWPYVGGWCEGFVGGSFGQSSAPQKDKNGNWYTTGPYPTAMAAWNANVGGGNHPNELPPAGLYVPVYFSLGSTSAGHVAYMRPDGSVVSSSQGGYHKQGAIHPNLQHLIDSYAQYNNGCTYLGWKEFVGNARVVKKKEEEMSQEDKYYATRGRLLSSMKPLSEGRLVAEASIAKVQVWQLETAPSFKSGFTYNKGNRFEIIAYIDFNGTRYYVSESDALRGNPWGVNKADVKIIGSVDKASDAENKLNQIKQIVK